MKFHFASFLLAFEVILVLVSLVACEKDPIKKVLVELESLPEPFKNDHLPSREQDDGVKNETCYNLMGCYEKIPLYTFHSDPLELKTVFSIQYEDMESDIAIEKCINCLAENPDECDKYPFDLRQLKNSPFRPDKRTIVIIGGYRSKTKGNWESRVASLWSQLEPVNVILVGWEEGSNTLYYPTAAANSRPVARQITVLMYYLAKLKGDVDLFEATFTEKFYLIGHSLGAHIAGFVGSDLAGTLGRITGLDPAGPSFDTIDGKYRIDKSDAQFVDILHTNAGSKVLTYKAQYGSNIDAGHIDLYANDGQHQPSCTTELFGCSHRLAGPYYESFLKDLLAMRKHFGHNYEPAYRLRAYKGENFTEFHDGMSLAKYCPLASIDDNDLSYTDLDQCSIPIDLLAWPVDYRNELRMTHGLNFKATDPPNRFYFYTKDTTASASVSLDHYMIRVRIASVNNQAGHEVDENGIAALEGCSVKVSISMANGLEEKTKINNYKLIHYEDHREVVFPYLSPNLNTEYQIANLDSQDFFVRRDKSNRKESIPSEGLASFLEAIDQVFPSSVALGGFAAKENERRGVLDTIKSWFKSRSNGDDDELNDSTMTANGTDCKLPIEAFIIQPLRKFRRHLSAFYKRDCDKRGMPNQEVKVMVLAENDKSPKRLLFDESSNDCEASDMKLRLDTIIIGPLLIEDRDDEIDDGKIEQSSWANNGDHTLIRGKTTIYERKVDAKHWLKLTVVLIFVLSIVIVISVMIIRKSKLDKLDQRNLMMTTGANPTYPDDYLDA